MEDLNELLEKALADNPGSSPAALAKMVAPDLLDDAQATLERVLPYYIRSWLSERRNWKPSAPPAPNEERFAPDDLLSDEGQRIEQVRQKKMLRARGSARVNAMREEWRRHFLDSLFVPSKGYIPFGEATAEDLVAAAESLRENGKKEYEGKLARADYYEKIAAALNPGQRVSDLDSDPTRRAA